MSSPSANGTSVPCSLQTCAITYSMIKYLPTFAGNLTYLVIFAAILVAQIGLGLVFRTWSFLAGMEAGLLLEVLGYIARILDRQDPFNMNWFLMYIICLTLGPTFICASIYFSLSRIIQINGEDIPLFKARTYTIVFITSDVIALVLQAVGGAFASIATKGTDLDRGLYIMVAGLAYQVFSLALFGSCYTELAVRLHRCPETRKKSEYADLRQSINMKGFQTSLMVATLCILIRSAYRVAELQGGFASLMANNEVLFMIFEGPMIITATVALTLFHPSLVFGLAWNTGQKRLTPDDATASTQGLHIKGEVNEKRLLRARQDSLADHSFDV